MKASVRIGFSCLRVRDYSIVGTSARWYSASYLICAENAAIVDVEATTTIRQAKIPVTTGFSAKCISHQTHPNMIGTKGKTVSQQSSQNSDCADGPRKR